MILLRRLVRDRRGATAIETAFALPVLIILIWMFVQLAQMYRAVAGMQQALGEGARSATLCVNPTSSGCAAPTATAIEAAITAAVYGVGPGTFAVATPQPGLSGSSRYFDLTVTYTQPTNLLILPGPTFNVTRSKRVWVAAT